LVWDRQAGIHAHDGRPTEEFAALCGQLRVGWHFCRPRDPQAKGAVERLQGFMETNFEPGRVFANERDFQDQLDAWFVKINARQHRSIRARPVDRLAEELEVMGALPPIARRVASNPDAYVYLAESIRAWPDQAGLARLLREAGWTDVEYRNLSGGIVALHRATRP
jgi:hypothetical protein